MRPEEMDVLSAIEKVRRIKALLLAMPDSEHRACDAYELLVSLEADVKKESPR